ncbi:peptidylprolyl isomerase [Sulfitobacter sp. SK012]|uniref:peptidyl-prolyl cis-trans isomerase n=1 Tax=Sulfitobacter sp. SK012 TaxID=1389005 RepID=UPI000E0B698E|nr:peptidyl-prolyl cis-trans isomerase [Sulfitobacter sp. SK012]AXI46166.1 peptidylprolyl isomerase [Sulfitobacter sp. SK012]
MAKGMSFSKTAVWVLLGLLILGLAGFGAVDLSGNARLIGTVGEKTITVDRYFREMQQEMRAISQQTGQSVTFAQAQQIGLDRAVIQRLVRDRALDHETSQMGLSIGDEILRERILEIPGFQGIDGSFDREGYAQTLRQAGLNEKEFEETLREDTARTLLQDAILGGVEMPQTFARTLVNYVGETRSFTWGLLDETMMDPPLSAPSQADLQAYFDANGDDFTLPETKQLTYVVLSPDDLIDQVDLTQEELRREFDTRIDQFQQPERRLVERLVFSDQETANQAAANLEVDGTTFEALVQERGLNLSDIDLGDMGQQELGAAGLDVFSAQVGDVVGPLPSDLGPALFRVNAVLPALYVTFEEAEPQLRDILAADRAVRLVEAQAEDFDDRLAGGATLEQLAEETDMTLGQIDWTPQSSDGLAAYGDFREAAAGVSLNDFPKIRQLEDGGIFAMRLDEELPPRPAPFEAVTDDIAAAVRTQQILTRLTAQAEELLPQIQAGTDMTELGLDAVVEEGQNRSAFVNGTPTAFMASVFEMAPGDLRVLPGDDTVVIVRLDGIEAAEQNAESAALLDSLATQQNAALAQALFTVYANDTILRAGQEIDQRAVQAVNVNFQ